MTAAPVTLLFTDLVDSTALLQRARNVRRWRDGRMLVRWIATPLQEVRRGFRRVRGYRDLPALVRALDRRTLDTAKEVA